MFRSGFVSIIGHPNVGKSTLMNRLLGDKVSIISSKPQTTRNTIRGIYNDEESQVVFIDTPGVHTPKHKLGATMSKNALRTMGAVDLVVVMVDATDDKRELSTKMIEGLKASGTPALLVVNKIDKVHDIPRLEAFIERLKASHAFKSVFAVSALKGIYTGELIEDIKAEMPEGPAFYPKDMTTDQPERFLISERIREKVLELTHEEIPHSVNVTIDTMATDDDNPELLNIEATIIVERKSQKGIIIGKGGRMIKAIGTKARHDILELLGTKIYLDMHVKVVKDWRNRERTLSEYGFDE
ncbi:MAG: GTPase Era [Bacillota bacterium]